VAASLVVSQNADLRFRVIERGEQVFDLGFFGWSKEVHVWSLEVAVIEKSARLNVPALDAENVQLGFVERDVDGALVIAVPVNAEVGANGLVLPRAQDEKASLADSWEVFLALDFDRLKVFIFEFTHRFFLFSFEIPREMIDGVSPDKPSTNSRRN
jgi:hypothetical protein